ncbi:hypothetical protein [Rhizobium sp.]|jgi:hypothetical protein|uniref:hypothetical protein n=1 Tax=Rhizobium sp. TaxID=391 RepID=UPI002AA68378
MSMSFSLTGADLASTLRRMSEEAAKRAAAKRLSERNQQTEERTHDNASDPRPGE